jgi:hypothetical protein
MILETLKMKSLRLMIVALALLAGAGLCLSPLAQAQSNTSILDIFGIPEGP